MGYIGEYIVRRDLRGTGIGIKLWTHAMDYMRNERKCTNIGLSARQSNQYKS